jgi:hypothetical protein
MQGSDEKVEVYYEQILKLVNCLQHKVDDNLLTIFFELDWSLTCELQLWEWSEIIYQAQGIYNHLRGDYGRCIGVPKIVITTKKTKESTR